jgi:hypothetical protein
MILAPWGLVACSCWAVSPGWRRGRLSDLGAFFARLWAERAVEGLSAAFRSALVAPIGLHAERYAAMLQRLIAAHAGRRRSSAWT